MLPLFISSVKTSAVDIVFLAPVTVGSQKDPLPVGEWKVTGITRNPVFHYNPKLFWDADPAHAKAKIAAGPFEVYPPAVQLEPLDNRTRGSGGPRLAEGLPPVGDVTPALYLGFDGRLPVDRVGLYLEVVDGPALPSSATLGDLVPLPSLRVTREQLQHCIAPDGPAAAANGFRAGRHQRAEGRGAVRAGAGAGAARGPVGAA